MWFYATPPVRILPAPKAGRKIFVAIPSYRDPDCVRTIRDLFEKAERPEEVYVGVYLQLDMNLDIPDCLCHELPKDYANNTRYKLVSSTDAAGPAYARSQAHELLQDEMYILNIDSHTRFVKDWDRILVSMLTSLPLEDKPILTTYPHGFEVTKGEEMVPNSDLAGLLGPLVLEPARFDEDNMLRLRAERRRAVADAPVPSAFCAAGFNFCLADTFREVAYAPTEHLFFGEETVLSARLWTHGYNFFAPQRDVIFHRWDRSYRNTFVADLQRRQEALGWVNKLLQGKVNGEYGLGNVRTLKEYEEFAGVDFNSRLLRSNERK